LFAFSHPTAMMRSRYKNSISGVLTSYTPSAGKTTLTIMLHHTHWVRSSSLFCSRRLSPVRAFFATDLNNLWSAKLSQDNSAWKMSHENMSSGWTDDLKEKAPLMT